MAENRAPTIYDVARAAGVAPSTVSRAFSRPGRVSAGTAERIREVARELGYRTNPFARALPTGRTAMIALVVSDVTNPFCSELVQGAQAAAGEGGYTMLLAEARESEPLERALASADGIVLATSRISDETVLTAAGQRPVVVLNRVLPGVPSIISDNARGMRQTVAHLAALGHEHVTYVAGPERSWADGMRRRSLRQAGTEQGIQSRRVGPYPATVEGGARAAVEVVRRPTTAVIAYNDLMAIGLIRALASHGLQVPWDVSVVGFDNIFAAELITPPLTTVAAPLHLLGETAVRHLLAILGGARAESAEPVVLPASLVVRGSTARRRRNSTALTSESFLLSAASPYAEITQS
ncbi:LacI family DNA-binding transcriptional regulator [Actinoplanes friuliensis]|jgi:DNA-binding LacI/PurR family transcriptional regulator|uniref:LacI family transcriptional regulator n=1 Tax=Actinoplanes friuliensis DSM 7358 TaxID=1246995 RepID=U5VYX8_9ACTN|nr:LacI family DNA-binding transcriptional regulator [Actinoplanes friuliensis]AGZ42173.1 LacI family transcriptional regulator [Actinoplanes friuliensis DSM 7358]